MMADSLMVQSDLQALIAETEALGWDKPDFLVPYDGVLAAQERFAFVGNLLAQKTHNTSHVHSTLLSVWSFAKPFTMEVLEPNKFLFTVPHESYYHSIINQGPWTIKGSLLLLQPWSSELAIDEVELQFCAFWVQVHELPRQFMTIKNAIRISKSIGNILELDNNNSSGIISRPFLRFKIDINTSLPLASGFYMPCEGRKPHWIAFKYEHLDEYCSSCGLIGHVKKFCPVPPKKATPEKYKWSLRAAPYVRPTLMANPPQEDSDSGISPAASVGNSPCCLSPSRPLDLPCSSFGQIIPRNQLDAHGSSNNLFRLQHVDSPSNLVPTQSGKLHHEMEFSPFQQPLGRYPLTGTSSLIPLKSNTFDWPYPSFMDPTSMSYLYPFSPNVTQLAPSSVSRSSLTTNPHDISSPGSLNPLMPHASGLFNTFLNTWSKNLANPSLLDKAPSPFQLCSNPNQSTSSAGPIILTFWTRISVISFQLISTLDFARMNHLGPCMLFRLLLLP
jgi:hypothetical protein